MSIMKIISWYLLTGIILQGLEIGCMIGYLVINYEQFDWDKVSSVTDSNMAIIKKHNLIVVLLKTLSLWPLVIPKQIQRVIITLNKCKITK